MPKRLRHIVPIAADEHIIYFLRHHWLTFVLPITVGLVLAAAPALIAMLIEELVPDFFSKDTTYAITLIIVSTYYLSLWLFFFDNFLAFYLDVWVVTNKRIVNIEQDHLFKRTVSEQPLSRVQDITSEIHGILPTIFSYGDMTVQTAGETKKFIFKNLPHPELVARSILEVIERERKV